MKILVLQNGISWDTTSKLNYLKDWFKPVVDLEFTIRKSSYTNIPTEPYTDTEGKSYTGINNQWYDTAISNSAKIEGFDCVIFCQSFNDFISFPAMGYSDKRTNGTYRIVVGSDENDVYNFQNKKYPVFKDRFTEVVRHELLHCLYSIQHKVDNTHKFYSIGDLNSILLELKDNAKIMYKYFRPNEIIGLKPELVSILDKARDMACTPFKITSGYRSPEKNAQVGGVPNSSHTKGLAVDLACTDNFKRTLILKALYTCGTDLFIEICKSHIHIDIDSSIHKLGQTMWALDD